MLAVTPVCDNSSEVDYTAVVLVLRPKGLLKNAAK